MKSKSFMKKDFVEITVCYAVSNYISRTIRDYMKGNPVIQGVLMENGSL